MLDVRAQRIGVVLRIQRRVAVCAQTPRLISVLGSRSGDRMVDRVTPAHSRIEGKRPLNL